MNDVQSHIEKVRYDASQQYSNFAGADGVKANAKEALKMVKERFAKLMNDNPQSVVDILNKNGIPTSIKQSNISIITNALKGLRISQSFQNDLTNLLTMKKNFADQSQGLIRSYNANDFKSGVINNGKLVPNDNFISNCKDCTGSYKNFDFGEALDLVKYGVNTWSADQQRQLEETKAAAAQAISAQEIQKLQLEIKRLEAEKNASLAKSGSAGSTTVKIIAVTGVLVIVGIATYFIFKKKKIS